MAEEDFGGFGFEGGAEDEASGFGDDAGGFEEAAPAPTEPSAPAKESTTMTGTESSSSLGHTEDVRSERSGWLTTIEPKKTLSRKGGSKERWFILADGKLTYASSVRADPIATIQVADIQSIEENPGQETTFTLVLKKKSLFIQARTEADAKNWLASLRKAQKSSATAFGKGQTANALLF
eukprot:TRINITY_DN21066_c0_g1_i1.p1 TRINITY_DN21066_c0_g1~~TRINITY_DN21066_c0_g1_i1.p1  ORF type:complete len:180 (+),score=39.21 TRINITY_DN21066_c0_g1_i1:207-746(+)